MSGRIRPSVGALAVGLGLVAAPLAGQEAGPGHSDRGWIGFRYELIARAPDPRSGDEPSFGVVVRSVQAGSPAERAGIVAGDTLLRVDGRAVSPRTMSRLSARLQPGERVRLDLRRGGRARTVDVVTARRPAAVLPGVPREIMIRADSLHRAVLAEVDSARVEIRHGVPGVFSVPHPEPGEAVPLDVFLFHSEEADSLRRELVRLERELQRINLAETRRLRELAEEMARARRQIDQNDGRLRELREREAALQVEMARLRQEMEGARVEARRRQAERVQAIARQSALLAERSQRIAEEAGVAFRPLTVYAAGANVVAGARLTDLNPGLAEYFDVEDGVLVTEVVEGTPAAEVLIAGDVIVRVGETAVEGLSDLRSALARRWGSGDVPLTVVRKGRRVTVALPRQ